MKASRIVITGSSTTTRFLFGAFSVIRAVPVIPKSGISIVAVETRDVIFRPNRWCQ